jgi:type IV pilus assembly protein PilA
MRLSRPTTRVRDASGFTLIELLVVMVILGLLAAIAIPAFFNQRDKALDADAKSDVRTAQTAIETYATDSDGSYGGADEAAVVNIEETLADTDSDGRLHVTPNGDGEGYTVTVDSTNTPNTFSIRRYGDSDETVDFPAGSTELSCTDDANDGCPSGQHWG